jgi:hypothetical protein
MFDLFKGTGDRITELRQLDPFTKIYLKDNVNVFITQGRQEVKVEAGEKLIPLVRTNVKNGILYIKDDNKFNWARSYKKGVINIYISMPTFRYLWHYGSGDVHGSDTLYCDTLDVETRESGNVELTVKANIIYTHLHGTADVTLRGKSTLMGSFHMGEGYLYAQELETWQTWFFTKASGDDYFNVSSGFSGKISWVGNVYLTGTPVYISVVRQGKGELIRIN